ncbi:GerAB/ArcD/ProY family transporter [Clostridium cylindrosporum]|uniref:Spore germination protein A n=1 Tax=Clostridium cylindrosporum DSM 605 TaxID=1121307 RepID=A0A0J8DF66_CLOCY|nr:endospore germination permease [Clostridium cylindrosporum]KMT22818.1 spore germination protein A [Clostridium cylindrosporum DSM 605]
MIKSDVEFTGYQLGVIVVTAMLGVGMFSLPSSVTEAAGNEGWISVIGGGILAVISILLICKVGSLYDSEGLVGASKNVFGKVVGIILVIPILICLYTATFAEVSIFANSIKIFLLETTPKSAVVIPFLLLVLIITRGELKHMVRFFQFTLPFIFLAVLVLYLLSLERVDITNMLPIFQRSPKDYISGSMSTIFQLLGVIILLVIYPYFKKKDFKSASKSALIAVGIVSLSYLVTTILCISKLGIGETKFLIYPTLSLIKTAYIPGTFIERLEGIMMSAWVVVVFSTVVIWIHAMAVIISDIFNFKHTKHVATLLIPLIYVGQRSAPATLDIMSVSEINNLTLGLYSMYVFPILFYIVYKIRNKKRGGCR